MDLRRHPRGMPHPLYSNLLLIRTSTTIIANTILSAPPSPSSRPSLLSDPASEAHDPSAHAKPFSPWPPRPLLACGGGVRWSAVYGGAPSEVWKADSWH